MMCSEVEESAKFEEQHALVVDPFGVAETAELVETIEQPQEERNTKQIVLVVAQG